MYVAPGWRVAPTGGSGKSTQQLPVGDQHKSIMIVIKRRFLSFNGEGGKNRFYPACAHAGLYSFAFQGDFSAFSESLSISK